MARHLLISQLDLAPKPNLVKPLQNQEPKYPFALSGAIIFSFACLLSPPPSSIPLLRKPSPQSLSFLPSPQMKVPMSLSLNLGYRTVVLHVGFIISYFLPSFALQFCLICSYWITAFFLLPSAVVLQIQIPFPHPLIHSILPPLLAVNTITVPHYI